MAQSSGSSAGSAGAGNQGDLEGVFDESLGDFDNDMGREQAGMATSGRGSGQAAQRQESSDAGSVSDSAARQGGVAGAGGMAGTSGSAGSSESSGQMPSGTESAEEAGEGQDKVTSGLGGGDVDESERDAERVAMIPDDIPMDGSAEDQVARQIREAAMAETDPAIRAALWDEYRKHTGLK
jgi:hypothetical protein